MQTVSAAWRENQQQLLVSKAYVEIVLNVGDPDSQQAAQSSANGEEFYSDAASVVREVENEPVNYATLERNIWLLNGKMRTMPAGPDYGRNGYVGNWLSGEDCTFSPVPVLTVEFGRVFDPLIPGTTITWGEAYGEWAEEFRVTAYNGASVVAQKTVQGNKGVTSVVELDMQGYDRITVEILKWCLPFHRPRIKSMTVGIILTFSGNDIMSYTNSMEVDPLSASLPVSKISFTALDPNGKYDPDNPQGASKYMMERQTLTVRYGYKLADGVEWISAGTFYLNEWQLPQNGITADFGARDVLEFMTDLYAGAYTGTLYDVAVRALEQANLPLLETGEARWRIDESLKSISVPSITDKLEYTIAEVLQLCANAACCVLYQDREGILHIEPLADGVTDYRIDRFNSYSIGDVSLSRQLKAVDVNNGDHVLDVGAVGETQRISNPFISTDRAPIVARWVADYLSRRKNLSGEFRADPRLDPLDRVTNENRFSESTVLVTNITYTYKGAFRGSYEGRGEA